MLCCVSLRLFTTKLNFVLWILRFVLQKLCPRPVNSMQGLHWQLFEICKSMRWPVKNSIKPLIISHTCMLSQLVNTYKNKPNLHPQQNIAHKPDHGRRQGGARGCTCTPWNLKMMTSYAVFKQNTLTKFRSPLRRLHYIPLYFVQTLQNSQKTSQFWLKRTKHDVGAGTNAVGKCRLCAENIWYVHPLGKSCAPLPL